MLRLKTQTTRPLQLHSAGESDNDEFLAIPGAEPVTLLQVANDNLPYGCQCPLCGGIFEIPQGILYRIEQDDIPDIDSDSEFSPISEKNASPDSFGETGRVDSDFISEAEGSSAVEEGETEI